jgi:HEAT repeat protein
VALGRIGPAAKSAAPALLKVQNDDESSAVREAAELAMYQVDLAGMAARAAAQASPEVRILISRLASENEFDSRAAAKSLGEMATRAKEAIPALALALRSQNKWLREAAAQALGAMGREARNIVPALQQAAADQDAEVRAAAAAALEKIEGRRPGK